MSSPYNNSNVSTIGRPAKTKTREWEAFQRLPFGLTIAEENGDGQEKDVTILHSSWESKRASVIVPNRKKGALWWNTAHSYYKGNTEFFICNICGRALKLSGSASAIAAHLGHKHPEIKSLMEELDLKKKKASGVSDTTASAVSLQDASQTKKQKINHSLVAPSATRPGAKYQPKSKKSTAIELQRQSQLKQIISEGLPLTHAECPWNRQVIETTVAAARAGATLDDLLLSNRDMEDRITNTSRDLQAYLKERIMDKPVCAAVEHVDVGQLTYSCSSVYWIEDFRLSSAVLAANLTTDESSPMELAAVLEQWDLMSKVKFVVADPFAESTIADAPDIEHIACIDSSLAEVASIALDDMAADENNKDNKSGETLLAKARELIDFFEGSIEATDELSAIASNLTIEGRRIPDGLVSDGNKAWWSTLLMLQRLLGLREAVSVFVSRRWERTSITTTSKDKLPPNINSHEWRELQKLFLALRPLRFACQILSRTMNKTASLVPLVVHLIYRELESLVENSQDGNLPTWQKMLSKMNALFGDFPSRHYQEGGKKEGKKCRVKLSKEILIAHALDPRFKNLSIFPAEVQEMVWNGVLKRMERARPESSLKPSETTLPETTTANEAAKKTSERSAGSAELDSLFQLYSQEQTIKQQEQPPSDWLQKCQLELKQYKDSDGGNVDLESNVLMDWWGKPSFGHFPVLWGIAQTYLSIPATASPPSRAFSGGRFSPGITQSDGLVNFLCENVSIVDEDYWRVRR